ncbi:hypothetical protein, partial [uncultured Parasphingorhabdus sp.]|uniref:hypothetical protein n=1 Tax=uncultured Parasphingorhabdus sp. TaxID=2709694 RepID=UPI0030DABB6B
MMEPSDKAKVRAERLARYSFSVAIRPDNSSAKPIISAMKQARTNDSKLRKEISKSSQKAVHIAEANRMNGPGIYVDQYLRNFLAEYNNRIFHGEGINQPSSFNILGAFVEPDEECLVLNLLSENHFSVNFNFVLDYLTLPETNHKYDDLIKDLNEFEIYECHILGGYSSLEIADSMELKFFGFACVREADELSIMALLGKKVENLEKEQIQDKPQIFPGKESFLSDAPYDVSDIEIVAGEGIVPIIAL